MADVVKLTLTCAVCGVEAAVLKLTCDKRDRHTLLISGFLGNTTEAVKPELTERLWLALCRGDLNALLAIDPLWAPCYCPKCKQSYCQKHWSIIPRWDEDFPDFYDCSYGACPQGHTRMVDD